MLEGGALGAKLAGAGGGGAIIALTLDRERTEKALLEAGAEMILDLDQEVFCVAVREVADGSEEVAVGGE